MTMVFIFESGYQLLVSPHKSCIFKSLILTFFLHILLLENYLYILKREKKRYGSLYTHLFLASLAIREHVEVSDTSPSQCLKSGPQLLLNKPNAISAKCLIVDVHFDWFYFVSTSDSQNKYGMNQKTKHNFQFISLKSMYFFKLVNVFINGQGRMNIIVFV